VNPRQISVRRAFDRHAATYDDRFSSAPLGESIRAEVWALADRAFESAPQILDLGAGTGEDTLHFARQGHSVTALDISPEMIRRLQAKAATSNLSQRVRALVAEMHAYQPETCCFDGIISNFGALNCLPDLRWLGELAATSLKPGSRMVLTTMGRIYPLESAVLLLKGKFGAAFRRMRRPCEVMIEGVNVQVYYHSLQTIRRALGSRFRLEQVTGLRALLPVPGWEHLDGTILRGLAPLDRLLCRTSATSTCADHFVSVWRYTA
jgi:SAM-dependent methyltransferase